MIKPSLVAEYLFSRLSDGASESRAKELADRFADYAVRRNADYLISAVARSLGRMNAAKQQRETVRITAPFEASNNLRHEARERIGAPHDAPIEAAVDEKLIGGVRIEYGSTVIDATVRGRLEKLKNELLLD